MFDRFISEEEIDVVTVSISEKPVKRKCSTPCNNMTKTLRHLDQPSAKRPKLSQKRPRENMNKDIKESCLETDQDASNRLSGKDKVEDPECKRNVHNVLERKRRNDLKYSFQVLRDSIPDLKGSERAPKVAILRKATDCILNLRSEQERLLEEKSILERTHQSLQQKLKALKESAWIEVVWSTDILYQNGCCLYVKVPHIYIYKSVFGNNAKYPSGIDLLFVEGKCWLPLVTENSRINFFTYKRFGLHLFRSCLISKRQEPFGLLLLT